MSPSRWTFSIGAVSARRAPVVPLNEPGVRRAGTGVCFSGGENRSRGESMGVAIGCEGAWPWDPPADPGPGVGCAEGARWFRGLRRGDRRGTDEGGPMGAGVICAASSPPAIEVVRGCAERVGQGVARCAEIERSACDRQRRAIFERSARSSAGTGREAWARGVAGGPNTHLRPIPSRHASTHPSGGRRRLASTWWRAQPRSAICPNFVGTRGL